MGELREWIVCTAWGATMAVAGCYSGLDGGLADTDEAGTTSAPDGDGESGSSGTSEVPPESEELDVGTFRMMRLTRSEYDNTVRDLLGDASNPSAAFAPDEKVGPFDGNFLAPPSQRMLEDYMRAAETLAAAAIADVGALTGCAPEELGTTACADAFVAQFGRRAYRRPLRTEDADSLRAVFDAGVELSGFDHGIELVVRAALQSPHFLYRIEQGDVVAEHEGLAKLRGYEVASRLSYFLWDSMPDESLFAAAEAGELDGRQGIEDNARRMLASSKAESMVETFHVQWMGLGDTLQKDVSVFPEFNDELAEAMRQEVGRFGREVVLHGDGRVDTLLTAPYTFVDENLAAIYGIEWNDVAQDAVDGFALVELDPGERSGLLTQTGMLAATSHPTHTTPVKRGAFVRAAILCDPPPPPPADVGDVPIVDTDKSQREQLEEHRANPECAACHALMDPIGYGLDHYDALGRYRTQRGAFTVDARGELVGTDVDGEFDGAIGLGEVLSSSEQVASCIARQWFRHALGRPEEEVRDATSLAALDGAAGTGEIRELMVALATSDAFRYRRAPNDDVDEGEAP